jgi:hypothetical protein
MKKFLLSFILFLTMLNGFAQFETPAIDGAFIASEYSNSWSDGTRTFYCTWDATYFYFAMQGLNASTNPFQVYFDTDPTPLANGGTNADGSIQGFGFSFGGWDAVAYGQLPFRGRAMTLVGNGVSGGYLPNGSNDWTLNLGGLDYGEDAGLNAREVRIPWSFINGGTIPASMNIFFYVSFPGGNFYGGCSNPADNDFGDVANLTGRHYFNIGQLTNATAGTAFSRLSFINSRANKTIYGFGATNDYWDVTSADSRILTIDKDIIAENQLRIEGGSSITPSGDRIITMDGTTGTILNNGLMNANPGFGNTLNYVFSGTVGIDAASASNIDVYNLTISGTLNLNGETLRTGNNGTITVSTTGVLNCGTGLLGEYSGVSSFATAGSGSLIIGSASGITSSGATGNIQTDNRTFSTSGIYTYTSAGTQVTGNGLPATVAQLNAVNTPGVTLSNPVAVSGSVNLNNGFISLNGNNLTLNGAAFNRTAPGHVITYNGVTPSSVNRTSISAPFTFHVGTATEYLPATVSPASTSDFNTGVYSPASSNGVAGGPAFSSGTLASLVNAVWNIDRAAGTGNCDVQLGWTSALEGSTFASFLNTQIGISRYNGTAWTTFVQNSADNTANTVTATFNTFSPFLIGPFNVSLPVAFTSFNGVVENGKVKLTWAAQETDNLSHYEIEESENSINFTKMRLVERKDQSGYGNYISFDEELLQGANYYRIAAVGKDGDRRYTPVIRINTVKNNKLFQLFNSGSQLGLRLNGIPKGNYQVNIVSGNGQVVYNQRLVYNGTDQVQMINLNSTLPAGVYNVVLRGEGKIYNQAFIK